MVTPPSYESNPEKKYPTLLILDGEYLLDPFDGVLKYGNYWDDLPEMIIVSIFQNYGETNIVIYGYTDSTGTPEHNLNLSDQRAASVKNYLAAKGLTPSRFTTTGMGIADPISTNDTPEGRVQNRRVEFAITANEKMVEDAKKEAGN